MKVYKGVAQIGYGSYEDKTGSMFYNALTKIINDMQAKGLTVEVQYQTSLNHIEVVNSALILSHMEE